MCKVASRHRRARGQREGPEQTSASAFSKAEARSQRRTPVPSADGRPQPYKARQGIATHRAATPRDVSQRNVSRRTAPPRNATALSLLGRQSNKGRIRLATGSGLYIATLPPLRYNRRMPTAVDEHRHKAVLALRTAARHLSAAEEYDVARLLAGVIEDVEPSCTYPRPDTTDGADPDFTPPYTHSRAA